MGFWQRGIHTGNPGATPILAEVDTTGTYRFSLRRWPEKVDTPIHASAQLTIPDGITGDTKKAEGRALPITHARLNVGGFDKTMEMMDEMTEVTFTVPLTKGECTILAEFIGSTVKTYRAYFLNVEREEQ